MTSMVGNRVSRIPLHSLTQTRHANKKADLLSQRDDHDQGREDNDNVVILQPKHFQALIMPMTSEVHDKIEDATWQEELWDEGIKTSLTHKRGVSQEGGLLHYNGRIYVLCKASLWGEIIAQCHDYALTGHPGIKKTKELVLREYWWPKMKKTVDAYIKGCKVCQRTKSSTQAKAALLNPNTVSEGPWTHISVDIVTGLLSLNGHNALLMIVDRFSKAIIPITCNVELSAEGWAWILHDHIYTRHGMPTTVISDWGPQFVSQFMKELYRLLDITLNTSTTFHLQTDGQTEHINQEIEKYLHIFVNYWQTDWSDWLLLAEFTHNNWVHSATGKSPFMVLYGRNPRILPDSPWSSLFTNPTAAEFATIMSQIHKETRDALKKAADNMKMQYDKKKWPARDYQVGDCIWLDAANLHLPRPKKKLNSKRISPFTILNKAGATAYKLKLPPHWKIHPHFNEKLLTPYVPPAFPNQEILPLPPPDLIDDEEYYKIEEVLDSRPHTICGGWGKKSYKVIDYFVKWKGWMREHNSWVHDSEMGNAQEAIEEYEQRMCNARRVDITKIITPNENKRVTMVLNIKYEDKACFYFAQQQDGKQK